MHLLSIIRIPEFARKPVLGFSTWSSQLLDDVPGYGGKHVNPWYVDSYRVYILYLTQKLGSTNNKSRIFQIQ